MKMDRFWCHFGRSGFIRWCRYTHHSPSHHHNIITFHSSLYTLFPSLELAVPYFVHKSSANQIIRFDLPNSALEAGSFTFFSSWLFSSLSLSLSFFLSLVVSFTPSLSILSVLSIISLYISTTPLLSLFVSSLGCPGPLYILTYTQSYPATQLSIRWMRSSEQMNRNSSDADQSTRGMFDMQQQKDKKVRVSMPSYKGGQQPNYGM